MNIRMKRVNNRGHEIGQYVKQQAPGKIPPSPEELGNCTYMLDPKKLYMTVSYI
jgi:hypothetical protein